MMPKQRRRKQLLVLPKRRKQMLASAAKKKKIKTTTEYELYPSFKPKYPRMRVSNIWLTITVCFDCDTNTTPLWSSDPTGSKWLCNACRLRRRREEAKADKGLDS
ncbi:putative transcription factor C2C2-GATA family [Medicago truncatula]|uniref:GATA type zinc finger transcription factor family protein n=1 Tax=Medicago truncatula TaxID=3880 RepID=G7I9Y7_MEDTR|nr:GATA type zinc finger transcription factor family protein [Medicago truncatula]RHN77131.1 putative transcription factor C2C2-GATA family [Medicago truncatula]